MRLFLLSCFLFQLLPMAVVAQGYSLIINYTDKDSAFAAAPKDIQQNFHSKEECLLYIRKLPSLLVSKGYVAASVDSVAIDSSAATVFLFAGPQYNSIELNTDSVNPRALDAVGWNTFSRKNHQFTFQQLQEKQLSIAGYYAKAGYPFAEVYLDKIAFSGNTITGVLRVNKGLLYRIDSIRVYGPAHIKNYVLQRYLGIPNGSTYNSDKLDNISARINALPYLQERQKPDVSMLGSGGTLNLYLEPRRSSQINALVGLQPSNGTGKTQLTGDVNLDLKNTLAMGESILINWQQLQKQSPKLNLAYQQPYLFNTPFGVDLAFNLYKKDSAYVQLDAKLGVQYLLSGTQSGTVFYRTRRTFLLSGGYDTAAIRISKVLPENIDLTSNSIGVDYHYFNTNYRFNPRRGNELSASASAGLKKVVANNDIISLKDPSNPSFKFSSLYDTVKTKNYEYELGLNVAHFFPSGKRNTLKVGLSTAWLHSKYIFRNELFRIGGYRLLRGFDEESIYANKYAVFTTEYRFLTGLNSYLYVFSDAGFTGTHYQSINYSNNFLSGGAGLSFESKAGILNFSYAIGKRDDVKFNLGKSSRIHFGYINYF